MMRPRAASQGAHRGVLLLSGAAGVGKSEVARYVCRWFFERGHFAGLYHIDGSRAALGPDSAAASVSSAGAATGVAVKTASSDIGSGDAQRALRRTFAKALHLHKPPRSRSRSRGNDGRRREGSSSSAPRGGGGGDSSTAPTGATESGCISPLLSPSGRRRSTTAIATELQEGERLLDLLAGNDELFGNTLARRFSEKDGNDYLLLIDNADALSLLGHGGGGHGGGKEARARAATNVFVDFITDLAQHRAPALTVLLTARENIFNHHAGPGADCAVLEVAALDAAHAGELILTTLPKAVLQWLHADERRFYFGAHADAGTEGGAGDEGDGEDGGGGGGSAGAPPKGVKRSTSAERRRRCVALGNGPLGRACRGLPELLHIAAAHHVVDCCGGEDSVDRLHTPEVIASYSTKLHEHHVAIEARRPTRVASAVVVESRGGGGNHSVVVEPAVAAATGATVSASAAAATGVAARPSAASVGEEKLLEAAAAPGEVLNWHFFLSHAAGEQGPTVQFIDHKLKDRGFSVWFDQSNGRAGKNRAQTNAAEAEAGLDRGGGGVGGGAVIDVTKAGMERGVQQSAIFVLVLSKSVFTRRFCRLEILAALQARRPFVTLHEADARYGKWDFAAPTVGAPECWHAIIGQIMAEVTSLPLRRDEEEHELMMNKLVRRLREQRGVVLDVPAAVLQVAAAEVRQALAPSAVDESSSASGGGGGAAALPPSPPPPRVEALLTGAGDATEWMALRAASIASAAAAAGTIADDVVTYAALQRAMQRRFARVVLTHTTPGVKPRALTTSDFLVLETYTKRRASIGVSLVHRVTRKGEPLVHLLAWAKFLYKWLQPWMGLVRFILPAWNCFVIPSAVVSPPSLSGSGGGESECVGGPRHPHRERTSSLACY